MLVREEEEGTALGGLSKSVPHYIAGVSCSSAKFSSTSKSSLNPPMSARVVIASLIFLASELEEGRTGHE